MKRSRAKFHATLQYLKKYCKGHKVEWKSCTMVYSLTTEKWLRSRCILGKYKSITWIKYLNIEEVNDGILFKVDLNPDLDQNFKILPQKLQNKIFLVATLNIFFSQNFAIRKIRGCWFFNNIIFKFQPKNTQVRHFWSQI